MQGACGIFYANGGQIIIDVDDNGNVIGVDKIDETLKRISDIITMQIEPNPQEEIRTELKFDSGKTLIVLFILKGDKEYLLSEKVWFFFKRMCDSNRYYL